MTTVVVGAGPVGAVCARALAEQGEDVLLVDPDPGPLPDGTWQRRGVMQFSHPHFFRHHVPQVMSQLVPQMWAEVLASGAVVNEPPEGMPAGMSTMSSRRSTFEAALRRSAVHERLTRIVAPAHRLAAHPRRGTAGRRARGLGTNEEAARAAVAVSDEPGSRSDRDLDRRVRSDVESNGSVHSSDVDFGDTAGAQRFDVRGSVPQAAHDANPSGRLSEHLRQDVAELLTSVVAEHYVAVLPELRNGGGVDQRDRPAQSLRQQL